LDKIGSGSSGSGASGDPAGGSSVNNLHSVSMPVIPPSPSSALDMHKLTLKAAQNQLAIKKLEEKNEQLQREIEGLRQDIDLLKKLVVSLDLSQKQQLEGQNPEYFSSMKNRQALEIQVEESDTTKRKPVTKSNTDKGPSTKSKESKKKASGNTSPKKDEEDYEEEVEARGNSKKLSASNAAGNSKEKKERIKSPREEKTSARRETAPTSSSKSKKSKQKS